MYIILVQLYCSIQSSDPLLESYNNVPIPYIGKIKQNNNCDNNHSNCLDYI